MKLKSLLVICLLLVLLPLDVYARPRHIPYLGYNHTSWGNATDSPNSYAPVKIITGMDLGVGDFSNPQDIFVRNGYLYILDTGNRRVVIVSPCFIEVHRVIYLPIVGASGIFVTQDGIIYIADTNNFRVIAVTSEGDILREYTRPDAAIFPDTIEFRPTQVVVDGVGNVYVLIRGFFFGAAIFDIAGNFTGFFGAEEVAVTPTVILNRFWRRFMTERQLEYTARFVPNEFTNFDIDHEGFIYTVTRIRQAQPTVRKINPMGSDILPNISWAGQGVSIVYGERERMIFRGDYFASSFIDIDVSDDLFITLLDINTNRIWQYDQESNLLAVFGGRGTQMGLFNQPVAIASRGRDILVLDTGTSGITLFSPTPFGELVHTAVLLFNDGLFGEAAEYWREVLRVHANLEIANIGIGQALFHEARFAESLPYFRRGYARINYSRAFRYVRGDFLRDYFGFIAFVVSLFVLCIFFRTPITKKYHKYFPKRDIEKRNDSPFYVMFHPFLGYDNIKWSSSTWVLVQSILVIMFWFFSSIVAHQYTGFLFNNNPPHSLRVGMIFAQTFGIALLFSVLNWAVSTLMNGNGTIRRIWVVVSYALLPYAISIFLRAILSNFVLLEEIAFLNLMLYIGMLWSFVLLIIGLSEVHEYGLSEVIKNLAITVVGSAVTLFVFVMFGSLIQELYNFVYGIYTELSFRML